MRYGLSFVLIATLVTIGTISAQIPATVPGSVSGHVYCADTHTPCRFASITIEAIPQPKANGKAADIRNGKAVTNYESMVAPLLVDQDISDLSYSLTTAKK